MARSSPARCPSQSPSGRAPARRRQRQTSGRGQRRRRCCRRQAGAVGARRDRAGSRPGRRRLRRRPRRTDRGVDDADDANIAGGRASATSGGSFDAAGRPCADPPARARRRRTRDRHRRSRPARRRRVTRRAVGQRCASQGRPAHRADDVEYDADALSIQVRGKVRYEDRCLLRASSGRQRVRAAAARVSRAGVRAARERPGRGTAS